MLLGRCPPAPLSAQFRNTISGLKRSSNDNDATAAGIQETCHNSPGGCPRAATTAPTVTDSWKLCSRRLAFQPSKQVSAGGLLRTMLSEVSLLAALQEEHKPARAAVLQHERLVCAFTVERDQVQTSSGGEDIAELSSGHWLRHIDIIHGYTPTIDQRH